MVNACHKIAWSVGLTECARNQRIRIPVSYYKTGQGLLQNAEAFRKKTKFFALLQNGQGLLQNAAAFFITKRGKGYYKTRQVL